MGDMSGAELGPGVRSLVCCRYPMMRENQQRQDPGWFQRT